MPPGLERPATRFRDSYLEALREGFVRGDGKPETPERIEEIAADFPGFIAGLLKAKTGWFTAPDGKAREPVPDTIYWLVQGDVFIGEVSLRHHLNDFLRNYGGHIGYGVRPSMRRKGYGTLILQQTLDKARALGLDKVMLSCDPNNTGSRRIIEAGGGVLEKTVVYDWAKAPTSLYWIDLENE